jgi:D-alanine transaminase/branched-chain amino acid aminotransferase
MGGDEILYHHKENIRECPRSNFFLIKEDDTLVTPATDMLKGITRKNIIQVAGMIGLRIEIRNIGLQEITDAKGAFICSSTKRIMPVNTIDRITYNLPDSLSVMQALWKGLLSMERASSSNQ